jgi:chromosome segregation ATPase
MQTVILQQKINLNTEIKQKIQTQSYFNEKKSLQHQSATISQELTDLKILYNSAQKSIKVLSNDKISLKTKVAFAEGEKTSLQDKSGKDSTEIVSLKRLITEKDIIISNLDSDLNIARDEVVAAKAEKTHMSKDFTLKCSALKDVITVLSTEKNQLDDTITELKNTKIKLVESYSDLCKSSINSKDSLIATIATLKEQLKKQENSLVSLQADFDYLKVVFKFNDRLPTYL